MITLAAVTDAAREALDDDSGQIIAAVPTVARGSLEIADGVVLDLVAPFLGVLSGIEFIFGRRKTRGASAYGQSEYAHLIAVIRRDRVDLHNLKVPNKAGALIESHPQSAFFYEENPLIEDRSKKRPGARIQPPDRNRIDTILTIGGDPFYVRALFGPDLRATLSARGIDPGLETDL